MAEAKVTVAVEKAISDEIRNMAQAIFDEYGIRINSAEFSWIDASTVEENCCFVSGVTVSTTSFR